MNGMPTTEHKTGYEEYIPMFSDDAATFGLTCIAFFVVALLAFVLYEKCKADADARLHPFHQRYEQHQVDLKELEEKRKIAHEIEYMSPVDHEYYIA